MQIREYVPLTDDELWVESSPFVLPDPVTDHPWLWRRIGPLVVRWKRYEHRMMQRAYVGNGEYLYYIKSRRARWWWRNIASRFSRMATEHDYFWTFMCPHCSYDCDWVLEDMERWNQNYWYRTTRGGTYFGGDYTIHWFEGIVTCPRCLREWTYGDSD